MVAQVLRGIVLVSTFNLLHYVQCQGGQCSNLWPYQHRNFVNGTCIHFHIKVLGKCNYSAAYKDGKIHRSEELCHYQDVTHFGYMRSGVSYQVDCYCKIKHENSTRHERFRCVADALGYMLNHTKSASYRETEVKCLDHYRRAALRSWSDAISSSTTTKATTSSATTTSTTTTTTATTTTTTTTPRPTTTTTTTPTTTTTTTTTASTTTTTSTTTATTTEFVDTSTATASSTATTALSTLTSTAPYVTETTTLSIEPLITTTALSTSTEVGELSSIDQGGINETAIISPERGKEYIRIERKRVLDSAKLKLLVISTLMTTGLSIQLLLIRQLRKLLREWYESELLVEDGVANAVVKMAAKKMKSAGRKGRKQKRKGALVRAKKFGRKQNSHRTPKKGSANVARSINVSSDDNTTDLYNFYGGKQKGSQDSISNEPNRNRDTSAEGNSKDSKEGHGKKGE